MRTEFYRSLSLSLSPPLPLSLRLHLLTFLLRFSGVLLHIPRDGEALPWFPRCQPLLDISQLLLTSPAS